jgi:heat shock protein HtpX
MLKNSLKTATLLAGLGALFMVVGAALGGSTGLTIGLVLGLVLCGGSYWFSDKLAIAAARAKRVTEDEAPQLHAMVRDLAQRAGLPMPRVFVSPEQQPNAFATGRSPRHAAVCVTEGITQVLTERELKGVLAHEMSHVRHRDILIGSVAAAVAMAITFVARIAFWGALFGGGSDDEDDNVVGALLMMVLAPVAAGLVQMAISRSREYEADRGGAELLGEGEPLARALEKIDAHAQQVPMHVNPAQENAFIISPFVGRKSQFANLFRTHPPTAERVARLRAMNTVPR